MFVINIFVFVFGGGMLMILPQLTRKSYLFGVKIPQEEANCPEAIAMRKQYVRTCLVGSFVLLVICIVQFVFAPGFTALATIYLPLLIIPLQLAAFVPSWKKAVLLKAERGWQVSSSVFADTGSSHTRGTLSALPWSWYVISLALIIAMVILAVERYPYLPEMIPGHLDANMQPTRYVPTTLISVFTLPIVNIATLIVLFCVGMAFEKAKLQIDSHDPRGSFVQHQRYRKRIGNVIGFLAFVLVVFMGTTWLLMIFPVSPEMGRNVFWGNMVLFHGAIVAFIATKVKSGQGGCKIKVELDDTETLSHDKTPSVKPKRVGRGDDRYWKLGMFYYNPDDPAFVVEDRFGTNLGPNYGRVPVKIAVALFGIGFVVLYVWLTIMMTSGTF